MTGDVSAGGCSSQVLYVSRPGFSPEWLDELRTVSPRRGRLAAAAFDVYDKEPLLPGDPLRAAPNLVIGPLVAGFGGDYARQVRALVAANVPRFLGGRPRLNVASRESGC